VRIAKAIARSNLQQQVDQDHLRLACQIMRSALTVRKPEEKESKQESKSKERKGGK
jgi:DNA replicative helicase MCM subunit Mcm2 (Cdc46/Mcm family)